ncbi:putative fumarylacetoacetase-like protein [Phaeomoniella chlamydospora]|uniref:Putative fumarylacetoacetase-like protein n=1 Tax=Phaeomoniella chlamydospora TaxID=158046 RepID=A0A0G2F410_PHACM|nr:putative fumarylacetoacetase-like protein [Phaeomoniella chlamydospora]
MATFSRLIRFLARDGKTYYGDAILPHGVTDVSQAKAARVISGSIFPVTNPPSYTITDHIAQIRVFLPPLSPTDLGTVRCLGLNFEQHAREASMPIPESPVLFYKPPTSISSHGSSIPIPFHTQSDPGLDYECELVIVISKPCLNVPPSQALDYVLGYTVGNDISHRFWQLKKGGGQWGLGKCYDGWAPMGPAIVSKEVIPDPQNLKMKTTLNGQVVQDSTTADQIFGVKETVSALSMGTTLMPGDLIFTGT